MDNRTVRNSGARPNSLAAVGGRGEDPVIMAGRVNNWALIFPGCLVS